MVRVEFEKTDNAIYMSHLDLMRCITRAIARSEIPAKFTEGFHPHLALVFASPLALGITAKKEYFSVKLPEDFDLDTIKNKMNPCLPLGVKINAVDEYQGSFDEISFAEYMFQFRNKTKTDLNIFLSQDSILVEKKSKRGVTTIDLKPYFVPINLSEENSQLKFSLILPCGNRFNVSSTLIATTFSPDSYFEITRNCLMQQDKTVF